MAKLKQVELNSSSHSLFFLGSQYTFPIILVLGWKDLRLALGGQWMFPFVDAYLL